MPFVRKLNITLRIFQSLKDIETSYDGNVNHQFLIDFFGPDNPDVEWYGILLTDGYPTFTGQRLAQYYDTEEKVLQLMSRRT